LIALIARKKIESDTARGSDLDWKTRKVRKKGPDHGRFVGVGCAEAVKRKNERGQVGTPRGGKKKTVQRKNELWGGGGGGGGGGGSLSKKGDGTRPGHGGIPNLEIGSEKPSL